MSTTTIRLPDELKARLAAVAKQVGTTPHNFILQAIAEKTAQEEQRTAFHAEAEARYGRIVASGQVVPWDDMRTYLEGRIAGQVAKRPKARKLGAEVSAIQLAPEVGDDFERILEHLEQHHAEAIGERIRGILDAIEVLRRSPLIGRPVQAGPGPEGLRELVIGRGSRGDVALYRYLPDLDMVFVLAIRGQKEAGYAGER